MSEAIPATYAQWRRCIEVDCRIPLTPSFIAERLKVLRAADGEEVQRFIGLYGQQHWQAVLGWFERASTASASAAK